MTVEATTGALDRASAGTPAQSLGTVLRAELRRHLRQGGLRGGLITAAVVGSTLGLLAVLLIDYLSSGEGGQVAGTFPVESCTFTVAMVLAIAVVIHVGRGMQNGSMQITIALAPNRRRLTAAQFLATAILALTSTASASTLVAVAALIRSPDGQDPALVALGVLTGSLAATFLALLAHAVGAIVARAVPSLLVLLGWCIFAPIVLGVAAVRLPEQVARLAAEAVSWTPVALLGQASTVSSLPTLGATQLLQGQAILLAMSLTLILIASIRLNKRDY